MESNKVSREEMVEDIISGRQELGDEFNIDDSRTVLSRSTDEDVARVWSMVSMRLMAEPKVIDLCRFNFNKGQK